MQDEKSSTQSSIESIAMANYTRKFKPEKPSKVRFEDVIGIDEYKEEVEAVVDFL